LQPHLRNELGRMVQSLRSTRQRFNNFKMY
jgi:hypothetical protein